MSCISNPKITGTLIKNYFHCKRQAYLYYYGLNFRNELVSTGEILHKEENAKNIIFEKISVDDIKDGFLIEYKKTSSNLKGTTFQVLYYLSYFREKGVSLKGIIKDITYKQEQIIELNSENEKELENNLLEIKKMLKESMPPKQKLKKSCKGCSFKDYCWLE